MECVRRQNKLKAGRNKLGWQQNISQQVGGCVEPDFGLGKAPELGNSPKSKKSTQVSSRQIKLQAAQASSRQFKLLAALKLPATV